MAGKESVEDRIAGIVRKTMAAERAREEEEKDPRIGRLRSLIREEVGSVLGDLLSDEGDAERKGGRRSSRRRDDDQDDDEGGGNLLSLLTGR